MAALPANAQPQPSSAVCDCPTQLDALVAKLEANYPGYHLEVVGSAREPQYRRYVEDARVRARGLVGLDCVALLQEYVAWFEDGHLFVGGRPAVRTAADSARLRREAPRDDRTEADVLRYLDGARARLDPVEGIWIDPIGVRLAVVRARDGGGSRFVAFVLSTTSPAWSVGDVRAQLERLPDGSYDVVLYDDVRARTRPHVYKRAMRGGGRLQRDGLLFHAAPTTWGRLYPLRPGQEGQVDPLDPRAPTARIVDARTVVFHVPSNVNGYRARLAALVEQYRGALDRAETLIIDLRGNEGGSSTVTNPFMPYLVTPNKRPARYLAEGSSMVLASRDNIAYFERATWEPPNLVQRLRDAAPGTFVPFSDDAGEDDDAAADAAEEVSRDVAREHPRNVAILTDAMTVSAAEAFVLRAMRNEKVTLFGQPTGSSIDYQTVNIVGFGCREAGRYFGYPTIVGSDRLPEGGVRPTGIVPDVAIDDAVDDPIAWVVEYYARRTR